MYFYGGRASKAPTARLLVSRQPLFFGMEASSGVNGGVRGRTSSDILAEELTLGELERVVDEAQQAVFKKIGMVLEQIRDRELFRLKGCSCMKEYVEKFQSFGWRQARRYMNAHRVVSKLSKVHDMMPTFETQVRCLATCSEEEINSIWERAVARSRSTGMVIDRTLVEQIKKEVQAELYGRLAAPKVSFKRKKAPVSNSAGSEASSVDVVCGPQEPRPETEAAKLPSASENANLHATAMFNRAPRAQPINLPLIQSGRCLAWSSRQDNRPVAPLSLLVSVPETGPPPPVESVVDFLPGCNGRAVKRPRLAGGEVNLGLDPCSGGMGLKPPRDRGFNQWVLAQELSAAEVLADMVRD
ncbi:hypothetical protein BSKO_08433 [Bryopsis sp. KO-2023]|nr:hypothetical protein BSKO_08433 [Bryopsis sp. KO-2023]